jgi:fructoselysine 6-kinase
MVSVLAAGDNVVDCYQQLGEIFPGGNCVNVSVFAKRAGATAGYLGAVANDSAGHVIQSALMSEGVDLRRLRVLEGVTASCLIGHEEGERVFLGQNLGVSRFTPVEADYEYAAEYDAVHVGKSSGLDDYLACFASVSALSYDFSQSFDDESHLHTVAPMCHLASFSGAGLEEASARCLAEAAVDSGAEFALVTMGSRGAILAHKSRVFRSAAVAHTNVVDTLGAGDTFIARVLVGTLRGEEPDKVLAAAAVRAADTCSRYGAFGYGDGGLDAVLTVPVYAPCRKGVIALP